jgi:hypothetical protein
MTKHTGDRSERLELRVDKGTLGQLDDLRRAAVGEVPSRADVIRELIQHAHAALRGAARQPSHDQIGIEDLPGVRQMIGTRSRRARK